jgi:hypothetical protein
MATTATNRVTTSRAGMRQASNPPSERALAGLARDAALARIGRARVLMLVVAVVLTALLTALASALLPGKSWGAAHRGRAATGGRPATPRVTPHNSAAVAPRMPPAASPAQLGLAGPSEAPQSVAPPPVQSSPPASAPAQPAPAAPSGGGAVVSGGS